MNAQAGIGFAIVALSLAGCGQMVTLTNTSPTQYINQTATYHYSLTITASECDVSIPWIHALKRCRL